MSTENDSPGSSANPSKSSPTNLGQDAQESAHDESSNATVNKPPNHGTPTHGLGRFLWDLPADTPWPEVFERYREWKAEEQAGLERWSE
jgi:hypothetical protein